MIAYNSTFWGVALAFSILCFAAARIVPYGQKIKLPAICTYVLVGMCASAVGMLGEKSKLKQLAMIQQTGLAFISMSAGAELYMPQIRSSLKSILLVTLGFSLAQLLFGALFVSVFQMAGLLAEPKGATLSQRISLGLLCGCVSIALAPGSLLGLVREIKAKGPFTSCVMGNTAVGCMLALIFFSVSSSYANTAILGGGFSPLAMVFLVINIVASFIAGWLVGKLIVVLLNLNARYPRIPFHWAILLLGWGTEQLSATADYLSLRFLKADLSLEGLLVTITAGYVATNQVGNRNKFLSFLSEVSPYVFVPFFTLSGAKINAGVLAKALLFAIVYVIVRMLACAVGCIPVGLALKQPPAFWKGMWLTYAPQGGMSFGLVAKIELMFDEFGTEFSTAILGSVLINNILGVLLAKAGIKMAGEIPDESLEVDELVATGGPARRVLVVGLEDESALLAAKRIQDAKAHLTVLDVDSERLQRAAAELGADFVPFGSDGASTTGVAAPGGGGIPLSVSDTSLGQPQPPSRSPSTAEGLAVGAGTGSEKSAEGSVNPPLNVSIPMLQKSEVYFAKGGATIRHMDVARHKADDHGAGKGGAGAAGASGGDDVEQGVEALLSAMVEQTFDVTATSVEAALVSLGTERETYAVCEYLIHALQVKRVVATIRNVAWMKPFTELGAIVSYGGSVYATMLYKAALTPAEKELHVVKGKPRAGFANGVLHATDTALALAVLAPEEQERARARHPDPPPGGIPKGHRLRKHDDSDYTSAMANLNYVEKQDASAKDALVPTALLGAMASGIASHDRLSIDVAGAGTPSKA